MRIVRLALWPLGAVVGVVAELSTDLAHAIPDLVAGWTMLACGLVAWSRRPDSLAGPLLAATGLTWFAGNFFDAGLYWYRGPLVHLLLTYPDGRARGRVEQAAVAAGYVAALVAPIWASEPATLVLSALLLAVAVRGRWAAVGAERRARDVSLAATATVTIVLTIAAIARVAYPAGDADSAGLLALEGVLCVVAVVLAAGAMRRPWERPAVTDLVVELGGTRSESLRDALARALGDPTLEVGYWAEGGYVDRQGRPLTLPEAGAGRTVTLVERDGKALAALVHDPAVLGDPLLVESIAAATRLAASNARLQAALRAQVAELESSRRRLVDAGDAERRRLEHRLRAGAGRRLEALAETLDRARTTAGGDRIARAAEVLARSRADLGELARGLYPASLSQAGLAAALTALTEASTIPVELTVAAAPVEPEVEATAYFVCAEALANVTKYAQASSVAIAVATRDGHLTVEIADDGVGGADPERGTGLRGLADRLQARGGRLTIHSAAGAGTRLAAEIPLGGKAS
jgi:signal transduction histidine kinase